MSPPSLGNGSKENEGCLQFHFDSYNVQNGRGSSVNILAYLIFLLVFCYHDSWYQTCSLGIMTLLSVSQTLGTSTTINDQKTSMIFVYGGFPSIIVFIILLNFTRLV